MLVGSFEYCGHMYEVSAYDFDDNVSIYLTPHDTKAKLFLDAGIRVGEDGIVSISVLVLERYQQLATERKLMVLSMIMK